MVHTTGCRSNQADGCVLVRGFQKQGFEVVQRGPADIYVINACTLTARADRKARNLVYRARAENPRAFVVLAGCLADRLEQFPESAFFEGMKPDLLVTNREKNRLPTIVAEHFKVTGSPQGISEKRTRRLLKVQDGCPRNCSYCIVPLVRGRTSRSIPPVEAIERAKAFEKEGALEIVLTGIHIGLYGRDLRPRSSLLELIRGILDATHRVLIRVSSIEPEEVSRDLVEVFGEPRVCGHVHLPLQSGSDSILRAMHRPYTVRTYMEIVKALREVRPDIGIGMDVMVGFPGEEEGDFQATVKLIEKIKPAYMHIFRYSPRPGTPAWGLGDPIPYEVKHKRAGVLHNMDREFRRVFAERLKNREVVVIPVKKKGELVEGLTDTYVKIRYRDEGLRVVRCRVTGWTKGYLTGEVKG